MKNKIEIETAMENSKEAVKFFAEIKRLYFEKMHTVFGKFVYAKERCVLVDHSYVARELTERNKDSAQKGLVYFNYNQIIKFFSTNDGLTDIGPDCPLFLTVIKERDSKGGLDIFKKKLIDIKWSVIAYNFSFETSENVDPSFTLLALHTQKIKCALDGQYSIIITDEPEVLFLLTAIKSNAVIVGPDRWAEDFYKTLHSYGAHRFVTFSNFIYLTKCNTLPAKERWQTMDPDADQSDMDRIGE